MSYVVFIMRKNINSAKAKFGIKMMYKKLWKYSF